MKTALARSISQLRYTLQKYPLIVICAAAVFLAGCLAALFLFRYAPSEPLWNEFRVLAVSSEVSEERVLSLLERSGIDSVISRSGRVPFAYPQEAPVQPDSSVYYDESLRYFSDRDGGHRLFFLPESKGLEKQAALAFKGSDIAAILDGGFVWNPLPAFFLAALGGVFFFFSKQKWFFLSAALPFLLFAFCSPLFSVCAGSCFVLAFLFRLEKFWKRAAAGRDLLWDTLLFFFVLISLVFFITAGGYVTALSFCAFAASGAAVFLSHRGGTLREERRRERHVFTPVPIMSPRAFISSGKAFLRTIIPLWACLLGIAVFFIFFRGFTSSAASNGLSIPAPTGYTENAVFDMQELEAHEAVSSAEGLPDLVDFIRFQWTIQTFPYRSVHSGGNSPEKDAAAIIRYETDENGRIRARMEQVKRFDNQFITDIIEREKRGTLESMLISQGRFAAVEYRDIASREGNTPFALYLILIMVLPGAVILIHKGSTHGRAI
jgi:hypothetical protein